MLADINESASRLGNQTHGHSHILGIMFDTFVGHDYADDSDSFP